MLSELCTELKNWFCSARYFGDFEIVGGSIDLEGKVAEGQFFRIVGSVFNDGVYSYPVSGLTDEVFGGSVWAMAIPPDVLRLSAEIDAWKEKYGAVSESPYQSESFGGYSYTKGSGSAGASGSSGGTWQDAFRKRLNKWRKI